MLNSEIADGLQLTLNSYRPRSVAKRVRTFATACAWFTVCAEGST